MDNIKIFVSVIISTISMKRYNDLVELLNGIKLQTYNNVETVLVIDENIELYNKIVSLVYSDQNIKIIFNPKNRGLSYSRNIGIENANGDIVAFIDDDAIPVPKWIESIVYTLNSIEAGAVTGDVVPIWEKEYISWFPKELHWMISCSYIMTPNKICEIDRGFGTNMAFKKELVKKVGMFNTNLGVNGDNWIGGEDSDMFLNIKAIGKKVLFNPDAKVLHKIFTNRITLGNIIKRSFNGGISVAVMKRLREKKFKNYKVNNSVEGKYLKTILFRFYPKKLNELIKNPSLLYLKQLAIVFIVMISEISGYFYGLYIKNIKRKVKTDDKIKNIVNIFVYWIMVTGLDILHSIQRWL